MQRDVNETTSDRTWLNDEEEETKGSSPVAVIEKHLLDSRVVMCAGPVTDKMAREVSSRCLVMEAQDPNKPITVYINSPGGSADSGFAIYDILRFVACPVRTVVNGLCASAGILIHLAGDAGQRFCLPESRFMIHQPSTAGQGTASDLDITAKEVMKLRVRYNKIIADAAGKTPEQVVEDAHRDFWLNADEASAYGIIDRVIATRAEMD
ncbi:MAG: ATP-dependent Clp protease proteolytic subunit [Planctomycetota bacterium]|nr:ATP-dependent Clp protease proteolytic subunit [Planctomycetota bacterium]